MNVSERNFTGKTRAITVTNILSLETPPPIEASVGNRFAAMFEETLQVGYDVCEPSKSCGDFVDEGTKRTCGSDKPETAKRPKCGNQSFHLSSQKLQGSLLFKSLFCSLIVDLCFPFQFAPL